MAPFPVDPVGKMAEAVPGLVRAGGPRSQEAVIPFRHPRAPNCFRLVEGSPSVFWSIREWFVALTIGRFSSNDPHGRGGRPASGQTGVSQRVQVGFRVTRRSLPTAPPGRHCLGARASRPHPVPLAAAELQCDAAGSHPVGGNQHRPGRRRAMAPFPVDPSGGDGRGCARLGAGGTPALPASRHPMTSSHQGHQIAEAFWYRLWLKEVHLSSGYSPCPLVVRLVFPRMIRTAGRAPGSRANGSFPRGAGRLSEKSPAPPHRRDALPGSAGVPPASCPFGRR